MNTVQLADLELANGTLISRTNTWFYLKLFFLVVLFCSVEFLRAWQLHGFTRAESAFVEGARDMLMHKQYIAPLFHGLPYFDKPPLHYWLLIFFYKMFGVSLPIARILSIAAGASSLVATSILVRNILGEKSALLAAMILATTVGFYELGSTAMPDMLLCSLSIIAVIFAYKIFFDTPKRRSDCLFIMSAAFALAWMTKGPIAILIPALSFSIYSVTIKQLPRVSVKELIFILVIFLIIVAPWHIALYSHYGLPAFDWLYLRGNVKRFVGLDPAYNFGHPINYMTSTLLTGFLPWTIFLIPAIYSLCRTIFDRTYQNPKNKFLLFMLCWAVCNTVFFSFSWSNWCYYSLPIYPALSILTAQFLLDVAHKFPSRTIIRISLAIVATFFFAATVYALTFLQLKAKHDGYLKFAGYVNEIPSRIPFFFHSNLNGQYLLVDHIVFETGRMPLCCSQDSLMKRLFSFTPFVALLPRYDFENLPPSCKAKLKIVDIETLKWINFPGCALAKQAPIGKPISLVLASHNCDIGTFISDSLMPLPIKDKQSLASDSSEQFANQHSKIDGLATWWLAKAYFKDQEPPDIVILGDSSLGSLAGADSYVYNKEVDPTGDHRSYTIEQDLKLLLHKNWHVFVGALPEGMVSDQLITSWALFSSKYKPRMVVVMLSPRNFIDYTCPPATSTEPYAFFSSHINIKAPFKSLGTALHAKTHTQISPLWLTKCLENGRTENLEKPSNYSQNLESNSPLTFGRSFERIAPGEIKITSSDGFFFDDNIPKYKEIYKKPYSPQLYFQLDCLDVLFKYLKQQHIAAIAVEMPLTNSNHILLPESFWEFYHNRVNSICRKNEVDYWDTESIWNDFPKTEFCDSAHLGLRGGLKLARPIVLGTAYTLQLPMYAYNGNFGPLVPGKEKIYFHRTWTGAQELSVYR